jgi:hypothetical protein
MLHDLYEKRLNGYIGFEIFYNEVSDILRIEQVVGGQLLF